MFTFLVKKLSRVELEYHHLGIIVQYFVYSLCNRRFKFIYVRA